MSSGVGNESAPSSQAGADQSGANSRIYFNFDSVSGDGDSSAIQQSNNIDGDGSYDDERTRMMIEKKDLQFVGCCHPRGTKDKNGSDNPFLLTEDELRRECGRLPGMVIYDRHELDKPVGLIKEAYIDGDGKLLIKGIFSDTDLGRNARKDLVTGVFKGLSLGCRHLYDKSSKQVKYSKIDEVSVCEEGELPGTLIYTYASRNPPSSSSLSSGSGVDGSANSGEHAPGNERENIGTAANLLAKETPPAPSNESEAQTKTSDPVSEELERQIASLTKSRKEAKKHSKQLRLAREAAQSYNLTRKLEEQNKEIERLRQAIGQAPSTNHHETASSSKIEGGAETSSLLVKDTLATTTLAPPQSDKKSHKNNDQIQVTEHEEERSAVGVKQKEGENNMDATTTNASDPSPSTQQQNNGGGFLQGTGSASPQAATGTGLAGNSLESGIGSSIDAHVNKIVAEAAASLLNKSSTPVPPSTATTTTAAAAPTPSTATTAAASEQTATTASLPEEVVRAKVMESKISSILKKAGVESIDELNEFVNSTKKREIREARERTKNAYNKWSEIMKNTPKESQVFQTGKEILATLKDHAEKPELLKKKKNREDIEKIVTIVTAASSGFDSAMNERFRIDEAARMHKEGLKRSLAEMEYEEKSADQRRLAQIGQNKRDVADSASSLYHQQQQQLDGIIGARETKKPRLTLPIMKKITKDQSMMSRDPAFAHFEMVSTYASSTNSKMLPGRTELGTEYVVVTPPGFTPTGRTIKDIGLFSLGLRPVDYSSGGVETEGFLKLQDMMDRDSAGRGYAKAVLELDDNAYMKAKAYHGGVEGALQPYGMLSDTRVPSLPYITSSPITNNMNGIVQSNSSNFTTRGGAMARPIY